MKTPKKPKPYWEMNKQELAEATREFDRELEPDAFHSLGPEKQAVWDRLQKRTRAAAASKKRRNEGAGAATLKKPSKIMPPDIVDDVRRILVEAARGKGEGPMFLTAYQILDRLPTPIRNQLISERGPGGRGTGVSYAAPSLISDAAERIPQIKITYIDTGGLRFEVAGRSVTPGYPVCKLYRLEL